MDEEDSEKSLVFTSETKVTRGKDEDVQEWRISLLQYDAVGSL